MVSISRKNTEKSSASENETLIGDELTSFSINSNSSVHPNILLRAPVFVPSTRSRRKTGRIVELDITEETDEPRQIDNADGYRNISIYGARLSIETDFKVWRGIVRVLNEGGYKDEYFVTSFSKFARLCGFKPKKIDARLRTKISNSLIKIMSQVVSFKTIDGSKHVMLHLLERAAYSVDSDVISLRPDRLLWVIYKMDYKTIISNRVIDALPRSETAVCMYMYIQSLPNGLAPISFERLRARAMLSGEIKEQNRSIREALERLREIGYLKYHLEQKDSDTFLFVDKRDPKLKLNDIENSTKTDDEDDE